MTHKTTSRKSRALLGALVLLGFVGASAFAVADNLVNDVAVGIGAESATHILPVTAGGASAGASYKIVSTGAAGGADGCNVADGSTALVTILRAPAGVTVSPATLTFTICNAFQAVTFAADASTAAGDYAITVTLVDTGGNFYNLVPAPFTLRVTGAVVEPESIDASPPEIAVAITPPVPDGTNGWYTVPVAIHWSVYDNESAIASTTGCDDETLTADTTGATRTCEATSEGGTNSSTTATIKIDQTAPSVTLVGGPADGSSPYWGFVPAAPTCTATDATSGVLGTCAVSGYLTTIGPHTVVATATDNAGNVGTDTHAYTVLAWTAYGFYAPANDALNTVKSGSTVPLKFEIFAGATEITDTTGLRFTASQGACQAGTPDEIEIVSTGATSLRYDATGGQFIQNWATPRGSAGQCWSAAVSGGGLASPIVAYFKLK